MTLTSKNTNTKTRTQKKTNKKYFQDPMYAIFFKSRGSMIWNMAFPQKLSAKIFHQTFSTNFSPTKFPQQFCQMFSTCLLKAWIFEFRSLLGLVWTVFGFTVIFLIIFVWFGDWRCGWTWLLLIFRSWRREPYIILDGKLQIFNSMQMQETAFPFHILTVWGWTWLLLILVRRRPKPFVALCLQFGK